MKNDLSAEIWLALLIVLAGLVTWTVLAVWRTRISAGREREYRRLAERTVTVNEDLERRIGELTPQLTSMRTRLDSIEQVLKEVD